MGSCCSSPSSSSSSSVNPIEVAWRYHDPRVNTQDISLLYRECTYNFMFKQDQKMLTDWDEERRKLVREKAQDSCPICLDPLKYPFLLTNCNHLFCHECLGQWSRLSNRVILNRQGMWLTLPLKCPVCRAILNPYDYYFCHTIVMEK